MSAPSSPPDGAAQPDTDSTARHDPGPNPPGNVATDTTPAATSPGKGPAWPDQEASPVLRGEQPAGGPDPSHPHLFHLAESPASTFEGGGLQGAHGQNWPLLVGQEGAVYIARLEPNGIREPHWHPSAWEMNFVVSGRVRWTFVGPNATQDTFEGAKGDLVFAPQGHFHYFENADEHEDLVVLIVFNSSAREPDDDVGLVHAFSAMPSDVLAAAFGTTPDVFDALPRTLGRVVMAKKKPAP